MTKVTPEDSELRDTLIRLRLGDPDRTPVLRQVPDPFIDDTMKLIKLREDQARQDELNKVYQAGDNFRLYTQVSQDYFDERLAQLSLTTNKEEK